MIRHKLPRYVHVYRDRHGKQRIYFNKAGRPKIPLPGPLFSEAFWIAYHKALEGHPEQPTGMNKTKAGTVAALVGDYFASSLFTALGDTTKTTYRNQLERFRVEHGDKPINRLEAKHLDIILGREAERSPSSASNLRKRFMTLFDCAVKWGYRTDNPMLFVARIRYKTTGIRPWTEDDIDAFRAYWKEGTPERIALEILLYTGLRRSDAVRLGRQHIRGGHIVIGTKKSGEIVQLNIPIHPTFRTFLETVKHGHLTLIVTGRGAARTEDGFTNWIIRAAREAGLPPESSPHGVRKASFEKLAEAGCSALEIMAITGHRDIKEIQRYCDKADQRKRAASAIAKTFGPE